MDIIQAICAQDGIDPALRSILARPRLFANPKAGPLETAHAKAQRRRFLEDPEHLTGFGEPAYESVYCSACNGSGEGMYDGSICHTCRGEGEMMQSVEPAPISERGSKRQAEVSDEEQEAARDDARFEARWGSLE